MKVKKSDKIEKIINSRYIERIYPSKGKLREILSSGKKMTIYLGVDPTGEHLHLGHSTNFLFLKKFQELGHKVIFLIGDFTAQIGDPTGKPKSRKPITHKQVLINCKGYKKQAQEILNFKGKNAVIFKFNSKWLASLDLKKIIGLMSKATVGQMIKRDMFKKRIKEKKEIFFHEFLYPLLQGYDSVAMKVDAEVGGNDQTFNMMVGRDLVKDYLNKEKIVITTKLLINPKTQKKLMSKSEGGYVALSDNPNQMYGKVMALPDEVISSVFSLCTEVSDSEIKKIEKELKQRKVNPKNVKSKLAKEIVAIYYGSKVAEEAGAEFNKIFKEKKQPSTIVKIKIKEKKINILDLLIKTKQVSSKANAKRLVIQKAIKIDGELKEDWKEEVEIKKGAIVKIGKRRFVKLI